MRLAWSIRSGHRIVSRRSRPTCSGWSEATLVRSRRPPPLPRGACPTRGDRDSRRLLPRGYHLALRAAALEQPAVQDATLGGKGAPVACTAPACRRSTRSATSSNSRSAPAERSTVPGNAATCASRSRATRDARNGQGDIIGVSDRTCGWRGPTFVPPRSIQDSASPPL